jgi:cell division protein FtsW
MARSNNPTVNPTAPRGQLTFFGILDNLARKAEVRDPLRPATRLFVTVAALMGIGFLLQASHAATTLSHEDFIDEVFSQGLFRLAGIGVMLVCFRLGPRSLRPFLPHLVVVSLVLLVLCFIPPFGVVRNGSHRWVSIVGVAFQPSELSRIILVMWIADRCVRLEHLVFDLRRGVMPMLVLALAFFFLILVETDLGGSMLLLICAFSTMWVGGARFRQVGLWLGAIIGGVIVAALTFVPYMRARIGMWIGNVQNDQVTHTLDALASGGVGGAGLSQGAFRNDGVPYLESDYVFALVGEELGLIGMGVVLVLLCALLWFSVRLVLSLRDRFEALCSFGLLISVALQAMVHVQVVAQLAPPKGMTLPFLSNGGTSLIVSSLAIGLALGAARRDSQELHSCNRSNATP